MIAVSERAVEAKEWGKTMGPWNQVVLIEDNASRAERDRIHGLHPHGKQPEIIVRLHEIKGDQAQEVAEYRYLPGTLRDEHGFGSRSSLALSLLDSWRNHRSRPLVLAGTGYGSSKRFIEQVMRRELPLVAELKPSTRVDLIHGGMKRGTTEQVEARKLLDGAKWRNVKIDCPISEDPLRYSVAQLGNIRFHDGLVGTLFAAQVGAIKGLHQGTIICVSSIRGEPIRRLLQVSGWIRWIRPTTRLQERQGASTKRQRGERTTGTSHRGLQFRSNIATARQRDETLDWAQPELDFKLQGSHGFFKGRSGINVVELFAGAGGMGLGFLLASLGSERNYRITASAEVNPIYAETLRQNQREFVKRTKRSESVPDEIVPIDLTEQASFDQILEKAESAGGSDVLIGGPPCQGFSNANRNSWDARNPHNRFVDVFLRYVERLGPPVFLMENVQGILWTPRSGDGTSLSVVDALSKRLERVGYELFPKLVDAVWYGVPQHRSRFFLLGLRRDLEYSASSFGSWGPFPQPTHGPWGGVPYVTVGDALRDLPEIGNGSDELQMEYKNPLPKQLAKNGFLKEMRRFAPRGLISDHVTSKHADYVLDRYRRIPQGGNWKSIADDLTNYADVKRTHSNIYRRLSWEEPSITIGNYRKSMLVHPSQHRGLSVREASRLQSFPDWFRFAGTADGNVGGLMHKQQQLANAVCPLVTKAIADFILDL